MVGLLASPVCCTFWFWTTDVVDDPPRNPAPLSPAQIFVLLRASIHNWSVAKQGATYQLRAASCPPNKSRPSPTHTADDGTCVYRSVCLTTRVLFSVGL